jgi:hypothetical protein
MNCKTLQSLPNMLPGWVCRQYVRRGTKLCGPYWYRLWREDGRLRKAYVRPEHYEVVRDACLAWQRHEASIRRERRDRRRSVEAVRDLKRVLARCTEGNCGS